MNAVARPLRIGAVSFVNTVPLIDGLDEHPRVILQRDLPARLADLLAEDRIDVGLIPVVEYLRGVGGDLVPGICIAAHGAVRTVKVFSQHPLDQAVEIAVDRGSRSSVALLRVLLGEMYSIEPDLHICEPRPSALFAHYDTVLVIGDRADEVDPAGLHVYDLGELWHDLTGLPFVFATWVLSERMATADARRSELIGILTEARDRGFGRLDELAQTEAVHRNLDPGSVRRYWTDHIHYNLGEAELAGLQRFAELAAKYDLIGDARSVQVAQM
jgi:chorismate dehydratase